jgi:hypothetical protein
MRARSLLGAGLVVAAGAAVLRRRRVTVRREHVDLSFDDGTTTTLEAGEPGADALLALARDGLAAARG